MAKSIRKRKCKNCKLFFPPDSRNAWHHKYCSKPECRKASKAASQQRWLNKEENRDHFRGPENTQRVQEWRKAHPGYWRPKTPKEQEPLQDLLFEETEKNPSVRIPLPEEPLQDFLKSQHNVLIGLIAHLTGSSLQDDIALTTRQLQQLGTDILNGSTLCKGGSYVTKTPHLSKPYPPGPQAIQLGGSPSGP
jgi:hypothetical protein